MASLDRTYLILYCFISDPLQDVISELAEEDEIIEYDSSTSDIATTTTTDSSTTTLLLTTTLPKSCPAPDITYNGSLLTTSEAFKDIHDVEFEVKTGPFPGDRRRCKLSCVDGQWVGPLCRTHEGTKTKELHSRQIFCYDYSLFK